MSFLPDFEDDIFISYAHPDNEPLTEGQKGWISTFHHSLQKRLAQLLPAEPQIFRDRELRGNDIFAERLATLIPKIGILISVVSPRYTHSEWCLREIKEFYKAAEDTGGICIDNKSRIFKVMKTPVSREEQPPEIQGLLGYEFYQIEMATGRPREFNPEIDPNVKVNYWQKIDDLAWDLRILLEKLKHRDKVPPISDLVPRGATIYLAETTFDLRDVRDSIKRDLEQRGHTVLPSMPLPYHASGFQEAVRQYLQHANLSIHLIGENYGFIPESESRSVVCLQNEIAAERTRGPSFSRLIWMRNGLKAKEDRQQQFIKSLRNDSQAQHGAELLETTVEELKTYISDKLASKKEPLPELIAEEGPLRIYLICDQEELDSVAPLEDYLYEQGYELTLSPHEGGEAQVREDHQENLLMCDACIIYYGKANELWLRAKMRDLQKIAGYGRSKPMLTKAIYISAPHSIQKERFRTHDALVIKNFGEFSTDSLKPFLDQIRNSNGGRR